MENQFVVLTERGFFEYDLHCSAHFTKDKEAAHKFPCKTSANNFATFVNTFLKFKEYPKVKSV